MCDREKCSLIPSHKPQFLRNHPFTFSPTGRVGFSTSVLWMCRARLFFLVGAALCFLDVSQYFSTRCQSYRPHRQHTVTDRNISGHGQMSWWAKSPHVENRHLRGPKESYLNTAPLWVPDAHFIQIQPT